MGRVRVRYLHERSYKGQRLLYWYPKTEYMVNGKMQKCPFKGGEVKSLDEAERNNKLLDEWRKGTAKGQRSYESGLVGWLVTKFQKDVRFKELSPATQILYGYGLKEIERVFGDRPITVISRQHAKAFYHSFTGARKPSQMAQVARVLFAYALDLGLINTNPFESLNVRKAAARETVWTPAMLEAAKKKAIELGMPSIALAIQLGIDTGQRPKDLRLLTWNRYNGKTIKLRQTKTGVWVEVPVMDGLKKMLDKADRSSPVMLITEATAKPYSKDMLCRRIRECLTSAGIGNNIQFRDLRRTAVVRLGEHGCEVPEICAITGHSLTDATQILEVYLPRNSKMAANAIAKLKKYVKKSVD